MSLESFLSKKLQKFSILDFALVKLTYLIVAYLIFSLYSPLAQIDWWAYLILAIITALPLYVHEFSVKGSLLTKMKNYLKTNNLSNQILLFITIFALGSMLCVLFPVLASYEWWIYVIAIIIVAIKPATTTIYW